MDMLSMHKPTCMKNLVYSTNTAGATYCGEPATSIGAVFCTNTTTTTSAGGYHDYSGVYTDNGCMA
jgi:hypothetical protein